MRHMHTLLPARGSTTHARRRAGSGTPQAARPRSCGHALQAGALHSSAHPCAHVHTPPAHTQAFEHRPHRRTSFVIAARRAGRHFPSARHPRWRRARPCISTNPLDAAPRSVPEVRTYPYGIGRFVIVEHCNPLARENLPCFEHVTKARGRGAEANAGAGLAQIQPNADTAATKRSRSPRSRWTPPEVGASATPPQPQINTSARASHGRRSATVSVQWGIIRAVNQPTKGRL